LEKRTGAGCLLLQKNPFLSKKSALLYSISLGDGIGEETSAEGKVRRACLLKAGQNSKKKKLFFNIKNIIINIIDRIVFFIK
jgi:hypothetical protein